MIPFDLAARLAVEGIVIPAQPAPPDHDGAAAVSAELPHLEEALTHTSFANEQRRSKRADNQRLEFLGDAVLGFLVSELLMDRYPSAREGELTSMRAMLVNTEALAAWARSVGLRRALRLGKGADASGEGERDSSLADAAEALVAAVYLDRGIEDARALVATMVEDGLVDASEIGAIGKNAKGQLQEHVQAGGGEAPRYVLEHEEGPPHRRVFVVAVEVNGEVIGRGRGRSKKIAEQAAAREALLTLGEMR